MLGAGESLRRKHIKTLEVCQKLMDENELLKQSGMGPAPPPSVDPDILSELEDLKEKMAVLMNIKKKLQIDSYNHEKDKAALVSELSTERALRLADRARLEAPLRESQAREAAAVSEANQLKDTNCQLRAELEARAREIAGLREEHQRKPTTPEVREEESTKGGKEAVVSEATRTMDALRQDLEAARAELAAHRAEDVAQREEAARVRDALEGQVTAQAQRAAKAADESQRLRAENAALEAEARRLSARLTTARPPPPRAAPSTADARPEVSKVAARQPKMARSESRAAAAAAAATSVAGDKQFADFVALRRENQELRRQLADVKATQSKTLALARRSHASAASLRR